MEIRDRFYHSSNYIWRRIQLESDIKVRYRDDTDPDFRLKFKTLISLFFCFDFREEMYRIIE